MKKILMSFVCVLLFSQISFAESPKIGVIDLQKIVDNSSQVKALKQEQNTKISELNTIIAKAQSEIAKEQDIKKIVEIQDNYTKEFNKKKAEIESIYSSKFASIEQNILNEVKNKANKENYDYIYAKSVVLHGGEDITNDILNKLK